MNLSLEHAKNLALIIGTAISLVLLIKTLFEYVQQGKQKRSEQFSALMERFFENAAFSKIREHLEVDTEHKGDAPALAQLPLADRRAFGIFLEEVAMLTNSKLITPQMSLYFFGYFAIDCWNSKHFWQGLEQDAAFWHVLRDYVAQSKAVALEFERHAFDAQQFKFR